MNFLIKEVSFYVGVECVLFVGFVFIVLYFIVIRGVYYLYKICLVVKLYRLILDSLNSVGKYRLY